MRRAFGFIQVQDTIHLADEMVGNIHKQKPKWKLRTYVCISASERHVHNLNAGVIGKLYKHTGQVNGMESMYVCTYACTCEHRAST